MDKQTSRPVVRKVIIERSGKSAHTESPADLEPEEADIM